MMQISQNPSLENYKTKENGCWIWTGHISRQGYGYFGKQLAHRLIYAKTNKLIPGLELDHLCHNRTCVNPDHLEQVTHHENILRGDASKKHMYCKRNHRLEDCNIQISSKKGKRRCWVCTVARYKSKRLGISVEKYLEDKEDKDE